MHACMHACNTCSTRALTSCMRERTHVHTRTHTDTRAHTRTHARTHTYTQLLGFDVMIDHKLRPSLLEINHTPSFRCDSPLDEAVKMAVLRGTMEMVCMIVHACIHTRHHGDGVHTCVHMRHHGDGVHAYMHIYLAPWKWCACIYAYRRTGPFKRDECNLPLTQPKPLPQPLSQPRTHVRYRSRGRSTSSLSAACASPPRLG